MPAGEPTRRSLPWRLCLGPLALAGRRRWIALAAVLALTLATQVGVVLWPVAGAVRGWRLAALALALYALASAVAVPPVAAAHPGTHVSYLDGAFPFPGVPLLPHLSHGDGRKLDLALFYVDRAGRPLDVGGSPLGYFGYIQPPRPRDAACPARWLDLRWDLAPLQAWLMPDALDRERTGRLVATAARHPAIGRGLLEPHLQRALGLRSPGLRFQGCGAARHDDHLHVQLR